MGGGLWSLPGGQREGRERFALDLGRWVRDSEVMSGPSLLRATRWHRETGTCQNLELMQMFLGRVESVEMQHVCAHTEGLSSCGWTLLHMLHPLSNRLFLRHSNDFAKLCPFTQRKGLLQEQRKNHPRKRYLQGSSHYNHRSAEVSPVFAGSHGVNTLLLLLLSKPHHY